MTHLIIPTGLKPTTKYTAYSFSPCKVDETNFVDADVEYYMDNEQLMAKLSFRSTNVYTSMTIKLCTIIH